MYIIITGMIQSLKNDNFLKIKKINFLFRFGFRFSSESSSVVFRIHVFFGRKNIVKYASYSSNINKSSERQVLLMKIF